jgi:SAM-dependent methyltransferase
VTETLARRLPLSVQIVATDLNQPMLDHAKTKPGVERVTFQQADALALPFPDDGFDVLICQFGVMFFPDRQEGFREARRVLKPGGRPLFSVWDRIDRIPPSHAVVAGLQRRYPAHSSWFLERTPSGYHDPRYHSLGPSGGWLCGLSYRNSPANRLCGQPTRRRPRLVPGLAIAR